MFTSIPPIVVTPPAEDDDKRPLWFSSTPQRVIGPNPSSFSRHSRLYLAIGTTIFAVCTILLTALIHGVPRVEGAFTQSERAHDAELRAQRRFGVLARRAEGGDETFATYVTTVDAEGDTSTLVYTTRPIVNPGGYTIGTLTGYVPLSTTTTSTPTSALEADVAATSTSESTPTYSTSVYSDGETSTFVYTTRPIVNPGGYTIGTLVGYVPQSSSSASGDSSTSPTFSSVPSSSPSTRKRENPFLLPSPSPPTPLSDNTDVEGVSSFDDLHLLPRRGINFALLDGREERVRGRRPQRMAARRELEGAGELAEREAAEDY